MVGAVSQLCFIFQTVIIFQNSFASATTQIFYHMCILLISTEHPARKCKSLPSF